MASPLPFPIQTNYAEIVERSLLGQMAGDFSPAGTFIKKCVNNRVYFYFRAPMTPGRRHMFATSRRPADRDPAAALFLPA